MRTSTSIEADFTTEPKYFGSWCTHRMGWSCTHRTWCRAASTDGGNRTEKDFVFYHGDVCTHRVSGGVVHITRGARAASTDSKSMDGAFVNVLKSSMQPQLSGTSVGDNSNTKKPSPSQK